jgi:hypothetical protein
LGDEDQGDEEAAGLARARAQAAQGAVAKDVDKDNFHRDKKDKHRDKRRGRAEQKEFLVAQVPSNKDTLDRPLQKYCFFVPRRKLMREWQSQRQLLRSQWGTHWIRILLFFFAGAHVSQ